MFKGFFPASSLATKGQKLKQSVHVILRKKFLEFTARIYIKMCHAYSIQWYLKYSNTCHSSLVQAKHTKELKLFTQVLP